MTSSPKTAAPACTECGLPFAPESPTGGLCPRCLIATAISHLSTVDHPALGRFGNIGVAPDVDKLNAKLPQFEFEELLGRGGAGWVFRARQRSLDRPVAIKMLHGRTSGITDAAQRFEREAQILARLKHPRIVTVHDYGAVDDCRYLVMEYVPGPTLRDVLRGPRLDADAAVRIADQICQAVEYAHSMNVLHRDLKPENVLFESFGYLDSLKVADFGISRLLGDTEPGFHQTQTGFVVGTPFYAAPEQMDADRAIDTRADIFSIGVMLYEMLTGQLPRGRFAPPSRVAGVPAALDAVTLRCLESDPARRYPDVASLRKALATAMSASAKWQRAPWLSAAAVTLAALITWAVVAISNNEPPPSAKSKPSGGWRSSISEPPAPSANMPPIVTTPQPIDTPPRTTEPLTLESPPEPTPEQLEPPAPEDTFEISDVSVYGHHPFPIEVRIDGQLKHAQFRLKEGASLVWVAQMDGGRRIDTPFTLPAGQRLFTIADRLNLQFHDGWPIEFFLAERWYDKTPGSRRLSNIVRANSRDIRPTFGNPPLPTPGRLLIQPPSRGP